MTDPDLYAVLGVGRTASQAQIVRAFRRLAFRWHPDRNMGQPELAHQHFLLVHRAYEVLSDPRRRRAWDAAHGFVRTDAPAQKPRREAEPRARGPAFAPAEPAPPPVHGFVSRLAWLVLSLLLRVIGGFLLLFIGPIAQKLSQEDLRRRAPVLMDFVIPVGRILLFGGLALLGLQRAFGLGGSPRVAVLLVVAGVVVFVIERIALASLWAFSRGTRPRA